METNIFHSVNEGLYLWNGNTGILIDGIHSGQEIGFSPMPLELEHQMEQRSGLFAHLDGVLFTHLHSDHFDAKRLSVLRRQADPPEIYCSQLSDSMISEKLSDSNICHVKIGEADIFAKDTIHDGEAFAQEAHQSFLIHMGKECFFIAGDALLVPQDADIFLSYANKSVDAVFLNIYHAMSEAAHEFLQKLQPRRVFLYHFPYPQDDAYGYYRWAKQADRRFSKKLPPLEQLQLMSWVDHSPPKWDSGNLLNTKMGDLHHV